MRIGLFTDTYHPAVNGICYVIDITRRGLEELGHEVYIFVPKPHLRFKEEDPHIIRYPAIRGVSWKEDMTGVFYPPRELRRIRDLNFDVIHFFTPDRIGLLGALAALKNDIPLVGQYSTDVHEYVKYYPGILKAVLVFPVGAPLMLRDMGRNWRHMLPVLERDGSRVWRQRVLIQSFNALHGKCSAVIALSPKMKKKLQSWNGQYKIELLPTGVNPITSSPKDEDKYIARAEIKPKDKVILYVGRINPEKNLELLVESMTLVIENNPDAKLVFAGDGDYSETLRNMLSQFLPADRFAMLGAVPREELGAVYAIADVFAFPSLTDTQGLVLNEAAGAGLPMVVIDIEVNKLLKVNDNCLRAKDDPLDFASKLLQILSDSRLKKKLSKNAKKSAARLTEDKQNKQLLRLYTRISRRS